jgi:hypothetical protein
MADILQNDPNASAAVMNPYDPYNVTSAAMSGLTGGNQQAQLNPYATDAASLGGSAAFFQNSGGFQAPVRSSSRYAYYC